METQRFNTRQSISPWLFVGLTYGLAWLLWVPTALSGQDVSTSAWRIPYLLGGCVPSIVGIALTYASEGKAGRRDFWRRAVDGKRIRADAYAVILLIFPLAYGLGALLDRLNGGSGAGFAAWSQDGSIPSMLLGTAVLMLLNGYIEELGWRGFALDRLQVRWGALAASLLLGLVHALWHSPLFFVRGTTQCEWGFLSTSYLLFVVNVMAGSVVHTWLYNNSRRSILSVVLLHTMHNLTFTLLYPLSATAILYATAAQVLVATALVAACGAQTLHCRVICCKE